MTWMQYLAPLLKGAQVTVMISLASIFFGVILAFAAGIARTSSNRFVSGLAFVYIVLFRGTPLLVQLFWFYYALPLVGVSFNLITTGIMTLALLTGAFGAEVVRGALLAVPPAQLEAARALNFSKTYTLWHIAMPQAIIEMMPPFGNLAIQNLKDTALVSLISIADLTFQAQSLRNITLNSARVYTLTLLGYFLIALCLMFAVRFIEMKLRRGPAFPRSAHS
ncbi:ectoine/hydroxyectoine ABC transporter permease subunit EhuC [Microvirga tunisiensis]|uniref:Ectoine/hydroxyectoine ABC transporter permease subunit EhuC n=1 Tax=Microvirga tunisiensis TaxID=2108360 RepID=A0A5N7MSX5_9HYPH|nr:ectoine/hydroxyectoine ABC transporter permease subunit EhuC [Microvirga tunisiensis]MPR11756.1 ectoine/hydroxyectoine ABC transporter permease subunit EhuC [Microvirga tunisiensis]MPR29750.1 ectoine/hydroxyectoine ABC transporter permease subunit EhuC [Microvirga tunisiensis]